MRPSASLRTLSFGTLLLGAVALGACGSSSEADPGAGSGGQTPPPATGGARATGGPPGSGGTVPATSGGSFGSGGVPGTGGISTGTGGGPSSGGVSSGGASVAGGRGGTPTVGSGGAGPRGGAPGNGTTVPSEDPGTAGDGRIDVGPSYTSSPDGRLKAGAPAGFSVSLNLSSSQSKIFTGSDFMPPLSFSRQIKLWVPQQYVDGTESPFMVSSDGFYGGLQTVVQNLADDPNPDHHVPALSIIGIQNGPNNQPSERSLEYDTVSDRYWRFVTTEVMPALLASPQLKAKYPNFKFATDPNGRGGYGCSSGGPAVMGLAWFGDFNRVFSFSGSFVNIQKTMDHPDGAWEYTKMIMDAPFRPDLRVFLEVGERDNRYTEPESAHSNWVISNTNMAAALQAKGNHHRFVFAKGAGHCDDAARNQVMPEGLIWLWRGYKGPGK